MIGVGVQILTRTSVPYNRANFEEKQGPGWLGMRNSMITVIWSSSFSTCRYFGCSGPMGPPWAHVLDFNLTQVRLFQTPDFCEA